MPSAAASHVHHIGSVLERLMEVADAASDVFVAGYGEGYQRNPAEGEPGVALDDIGSHVTAVVALADHALISGNLLAEGVFTAHKEEEHVEDRPSLRGRQRDIVLYGRGTMGLA